MIRSRCVGIYSSNRNLQIVLPGVPPFALPGQVAVEQRAPLGPRSASQPRRAWSRDCSPFTAAQPKERPRSAVLLAEEASAAPMFSNRRSQQSVSLSKSVSIQNIAG